MQVLTEFSQAIESLYTEAQSFLSQEAEEGEEDAWAHDSVINRLESALSVIEECIHLLSADNLRFATELQLLSIMRQQGGRILRRVVYGSDDCTVPPIGTGGRVIISGLAGRPSIALNVEHIEFLRTSGYTWEEVASVLGVSRSTVWRRLQDSNLHIDKYTDISDSQLDNVVSQVQQQHPNVGQVMLQAFLKQRGVIVQRYRVRESVFRTDPLRRSLRWHQALTRRTYSVKEPTIFGI